MSSVMEYKNYVGSVEFSEADGLFYGKVLGVRALISYEGTNAKELVEDFMVQLKRTWPSAERKEESQSGHTKEVLMCEYPRNFTDRQQFMHQPIR